MKKILSILALAASVSLGYSQGTVIFGSLSAINAISTNSATLGSGLQGTAAKTPTAAGGYYYALLTQTYTGNGATSFSSNPTAWTFSGAYSTNSTLLAGGTAGGTATIAGWAPGTTDYIEVVGWSANEGSTYAQVLAEYQSGSWANLTGFFGYSAAGYVASGGVGSPASPGNPVFGGTGVGAFDLYAVPTPEPATVALIGLGGLGLAMIRRRK